MPYVSCIRGSIAFNAVSDSFVVAALSTYIVIINLPSRIIVLYSYLLGRNSFSNIYLTALFVNSLSIKFLNIYNFLQ